MESTGIFDKNWKALIKPSKLQITSNDDKSIAKVIAEPLEKGFAQTLGNSLRRILLSSIQGAAVTAIQIDGVLHEFSSIKGVREDVTDIVLNVKNLAIKLSSEGPKKIILDAVGPKEVKAKDISLVSDVEIINPDQTICNLDEKTKFHMELIVSTGRGYVLAQKNKSEETKSGIPYIGGGWAGDEYKQLGIEYHTNMTLISCFITSFHAWFWCLFVFTWGAKYLNRPSKNLAYLNQGVYPFYIVHHFNFRDCCSYFWMLDIL